MPREIHPHMPQALKDRIQRQNDGETAAEAARELGAPLTVKETVYGQEMTRSGRLKTAVDGSMILDLTTDNAQRDPLPLSFTITQPDGSAVVYTGQVVLTPTEMTAEVTPNVG